MLDTARRCSDPFSQAFVESWSSITDWRRVGPQPPELLLRLANAAPAAVDLNRRRCRRLLHDLRVHLATLEIMPTLAACVLTDIRRREQSRVEGGDDTLEPEVELLGGLMLAPHKRPLVRRPPIAGEVDQIVWAALRGQAYATLADVARRTRDGATHEASLRSALRSAFFTVRGTTYLRHSDDLARSLFGGQDSHWFLERFQFEIDDVIAVREANRARWHAGFRNLFHQAHEGLATAGDPRSMRRMMNARVLTGLADAMAVRLDRLDRDLPDVDPERARAVITQLSCNVDEEWRFEDVDSESPLLRRPWMREADRALLMLPGRFDTELVALFEPQLLHEMKRFSRRRARAVDVETVRRLGSVLPGSTQHIGLRYEVLDAGHRREPEMDGLVLYQDVAIVVEGKGSQLSRSARRGDLRRLKADMRPVAEAWRQAQRGLHLLGAGRPVELRDSAGNAVRVRSEQARKTYGVLPTLHPLTDWYLQPGDLVRLGILPRDAYPWVVSVTDLRVVTDSIRRPAELIAYMAWRQEVLSQERVIVPDEIELFGAFLWGSDVSVGFEDADVKMLIFDMQSDFDDYHRRLEAGDPQARPPAKRLTPLVETHLTDLERRQPAGWLDESVECLIAPYTELHTVEAAAPELATRLATSDLANGAFLGDSAVVCFDHRRRLDAVSGAVSAKPSLLEGRRVFFVACGPEGLRLAAVDVASSLRRSA